MPTIEFGDNRPFIYGVNSSGGEDACDIKRFALSNCRGRDGLLIFAFENFESGGTSQFWKLIMAETEVSGTS